MTEVVPRRNKLSRDVDVKRVILSERGDFADAAVRGSLEAG